jgi:CRP-like cAMP-binding protein
MIGDAFGEIALISDIPRTASVHAATACELWSIRREIFQQTLKELNAHRYNDYKNFIQGIDVFAHMTPDL